MAWENVKGVARFPKMDPEVEQKCFACIKNPWKLFAAGKVVGLGAQLLDILPIPTPWRISYSLIGNTLNLMNMGKVYVDARRIERSQHLIKTVAVSALFELVNYGP